MKEETPSKELRRALKQAIYFTTSIEHVREHLYDEVEANQLGLSELVQIRPSKIPELSQKLKCDDSLAEKFHHYCCQEYSKMNSLGERFCLAPTVNYVKWSAKKAASISPSSPNITPKTKAERAREFTPGEGKVPKTASLDGLSPAPDYASPEWLAGGPPALNTQVQFNKREEKRRSQDESEQSQKQKKLDEERERKDRLFKLAIRGPRERPA